MTIIVPEIDISILPASHKVQNEMQKILFVGQMTSAGSAIPNTLYENIDNLNGQDALFGKNSMLATMIRAAKYHNKVSRIDAIPLEDNAAGAKAAGSIVFTGTATENGVITISIGSKGNISTLKHVYEIDITNLETATLIGDALVAAITADTTSPVTAVNTIGSVAITAIHKGTEGNNIGLKINGNVAGITYVLTGMTGGLTDPVLTSLFDVVGDTRYQTIVYPQYVMATAKEFLNARFNIDKKIVDGVGISCLVDTKGNIETIGNAENSQSLVIIANKKINTPLLFYVAPGIFEIDTIIASQIAAIRALRLTTDTNLSQYMSATYGSLDAFGGSHIASLPYFNTILPSLPIEKTGMEFIESEIDELVAAGITIVGNDIGNNKIIMGNTVTTYKKDGSGEDDVSFKYLEYVDTAVTCREYFYNNLRERFANSRLTSGNIKDGHIMANEQIIKSFITNLYTDLADLTLVEIGTDSETGIDWLDYFKQNLIVILDLALGKVTVTMRLPIVTQLRKIVMTIQLSFSTNN